MSFAQAITPFFLHVNHATTSIFLQFVRYIAEWFFANISTVVYMKKKRSNGLSKRHSCNKPFCDNDKDLFKAPVIIYGWGGDRLFHQPIGQDPRKVTSK